jgi:signal peptidase
MLAACGAFALAWFVWLRPISVGGDASYIVVKGTSMEPTYHSGDLVIAHQGGTYHRGDIIAFRAGGRFNDPAIVIHRIVGGNATQGFVTQGDNRDRTDPWRPKSANVVGRASFSVPYAGRIAETVRQPWAVAVLGAAAVLAETSRRKRRRAVLRRREPVLPPYISWRAPEAT